MEGGEKEVKFLSLLPGTEFAVIKYLKWASVPLA